MNAYHRKLRKKWKRADQKRKTAENKQIRAVAERLLGTKHGWYDNEGRPHDWPEPQEHQ